MAKKAYDVIIIGAGHNGLTCGAYLAAGGLDVLILERRSVVGGAAVTEEFHPGFRNSLAAYTVSLLNPKVIADLDLMRHGLEIIGRRMNNFWPLDGGDSLAFPTNLGDLQSEVSKFSTRDAARLPDYYATLGRLADVLRQVIMETPPNVGGGILEGIKALKMANRLRKLDFADEQWLLDVFTLSAAEFLDKWFENETIKGALAFDGIVGFYGSPHSAGTAYVLLHHAFGEVNGEKGVWGHAKGGMGAITQAMAGAARERGAEIITDAAVEAVRVEAGRTTGVVLADGRQFKAKAVAANVGPKLLYLEMIAAEELPEDFRDRIGHYKCGSGVFRMNVALSELPDFTCRPGREVADHHTAGIVIGPSIDYLDRAYRDAVDYGWSRAPIVEMLIPSTVDDTLAPKGAHVASLFAQQFAPELPDGKSWDQCREQAADLIIETVNAHAPNFKASVLGRQILSPLDLERVLGLSGGDIMHGRLSLDQMFSARPQLGFADYRGPLKGLYHCGAGAHPGGGVTGLPGHNAAREILKDFKRRRLS